MTERRRFWSAGAVGTVALATITWFILAGGIALPLHLGSIGSFRMYASRMIATNVTLAVDLDTDSAATDTALAADGAVPVAAIGVGTLTSATGLVIEKTFDFAPVVPSLGTWKFKLYTLPAATVTGSGLTILTPHLCANTVDLGTFGLNGRRAGTVDPRDDLLLTAATATFGNNTADAVELEVTQLSATSLSVPNLHIRLLQGGYTAADYDCLGL